MSCHLDPLEEARTIAGNLTVSLAEANATIESQAREIAELRAERDRNLAEATKLDAENTSLSRQAQSGIAEADFQRRRANGLNLQLAKQSAQIDTLRARAEAAERDAAELRRVARYVEIPVRNAMRGVNVIRLAGEPCQNIEVSWHTAYESAQEFLAAIAAGGK